MGHTPVLAHGALFDDVLVITSGDTYAKQRLVRTKCYDAMYSLN